jgi:hypothetical protein
VGRPRKHPGEHEAGTGMTREALRTHTGLAAEPGPSQSYPAPDAMSDSPSGTVRPYRPEEKREPVTLLGHTRYAEHPSERGVSGAERTARAARGGVTSTVTSPPSTKGGTSGPADRDALNVDGDGGKGLVRVAVRVVEVHAATGGEDEPVEGLGVVRVLRHGRVAGDVG